MWAAQIGHLDVVRCLGKELGAEVHEANAIGEGLLLIVFAAVVGSICKLKK